MRIGAWRLRVGVGIIACLLFGATDSALSEPQTGQLNGTSPDIGGCEAVVEYSAVTGDPVKANKSAIFRGFIVASEHSSEDVNLQWTFSEGEAIRGGTDVFKDPGRSQITQERGVEFSSTTSDDTQTVELQFPSDNNTNVDIGFIAYKGLSSSSAPSEPVYKVGLPSEVKFNELTCNRAPDGRLPQYVGVEDKDAVEPRKKVLELEYLPIEFTNMRFYNGFASNFAIFTFRIKNVGNKPINLTDVELEYWFDGGDFQDKPPNLLYKSLCMTSTLTGCENFRINILPGYRYIRGAHYKVKIGFSEEAGALSPEPGLDFGGHLGLGDEEEEEERPPFMLEAIVNVTSVQFFSQIDVTKDYSFLNTTVIEEDSQLPPQLVSRKYEPNKKFPVYYKGEIVYGARPKSGDQQVKPVSDPNRNQCWFKKPGIQQCGLRVKYCCVNPPPPDGTSTDLDVLGDPVPVTIPPPDEQEALPDWAVVVIVLLLGLVLACACVCAICRWKRAVCFSRRPFLKSGSSHDDILGPMRDEFGSHAWSIVNGESKKEIRVVKKSPTDFGDSDGEDEIRRSSTKFHTVPSISGVDSCLLLDKAANWDPREEKTWTGHIHWLWEPWNVSEVRRTATALPPVGKPGQFFTLSTKKLPMIDVKVDFKTEIEPYLGEQLGEGGFGKVFKAMWRDQDVAVKVLKVDTEAMIRSLEDEIKLSSKMHNERVVRLLGACLGNKDNVCLIMELVEGGNLSKRIHNKNLRRLEYLEVLQIGLDIVHGLAYLHPSVIHRDLKPQNVLLNKDGRAKIADFGISKFKDPHKSYLSVTQTGGTPNYMAPELFNGTRVDEKCDIFSLGCILYEAMSRRVPLSDLPSDNCAPLFQIIKTVAIDKRRPKIPDNFPADLADLVRACWKDNPRSRPGSSEVAKELERMIDDEVGRQRRLRKAAHTPGRKDSSQSSASADSDRTTRAATELRRSEKGEKKKKGRGRSFDPDSSGRSARIPPGKTVFSLLDRKKSRRAKVTAGKAVELETFHSAMSSQYYTSASESTDRPLIEDLDRADTLRRSGIWTQQASVFEQTTHPSFDSSRNSSGSSSSVRKSAGSRDMSSYVDSTTNLKYAPPGQSLAVVIEPRRQSLPESSSPDPYGFGVLSGQLEGSQDLDADVKRHPRTTTRFKELEAMEPDEDFAEELLEMKKRMNRPARV